MPCGLSITVPYFSTLPQRRNDFRGKKFTEPKMYILISSKILSETFLTLRRIHWETIINVHGSSCKVHVILLRFLWNLHFLKRFSTDLQTLISWKFAQWEPNSSLETDGQTDMTKLTAAFRNFAKEPKNFQHQRLQVVRAKVHYILASTAMVSRRFAGDYQHFEETCGLYFQRYIEVPLQTRREGGVPLKHR
jgi:hypothetical protein